ncbi:MULTISPECIES: hypothetical protein [unclassified Microcystis]|uniref:hypothetical protein n=1 Tax=unclassified Microcystis TaxID=2643300 RepID=UPI00257EE40E|nr:MULTISPECIES: hypothetical protein [unclassified Microcystis]MCA2609559.1 hypothetical protein [Microcystis sp. M27BS1]MCA2516721.1 hypothetical protein [Microcystis sp. M59BS1]MCA2530661.1 hypothetical protein [Microcystis sp. M51BS1]MCA2547157.1 hypothetical protein [Microcystis sp. M55BS1]MCA2555687.1 hypothetical protein [Microcystis sp. M43BS1]
MVRYKVFLWGESVFSYQLSVISYQLSAFFSLLPSPHFPTSPLATEKAAMQPLLGVRAA